MFLMLRRNEIRPRRDCFQSVSSKLQQAEKTLNGLEAIRQKAGDNILSQIHRNNASRKRMAIT